MPEKIYHLRIKKDYANSVIEDLQKMEAVEILTETPIPEWQMKEVKKRLQSIEDGNSLTIPWEEAIEKIQAMK